MEMKIQSNIPTIVLAVIILVCTVILPFIALANFHVYYQWSFGRFEVYNNFPGYSEGELNSHFSSVLQYINIPFNTELDPEFFSTEDILHMVDVRNVFIIINIIFIGLGGLAATLLTILNINVTKLFKILSRFLLSYISVLAVIGIYLIFTWQSGFQLLHQLLFPYNTYWILDPASSNLIRYLPERIFQELALLYFVSVCIEWGIIRFIPTIVGKKTTQNYN